MYKLWYVILYALCLIGCEPKQKTKEYMPTTATEVTHPAYIVGIHPYLNAQKTYLSYQPILEYLESRIPNVSFKLETSEDYAHYDEKLRQQVFDFSLPNPYQTVTSFQYHYHAIAKMKPDSEFRGLLVARKDRQIRSISRLKNNKISFPAPTALAAAMMPLYYLHQEGLDTHTQIEKLYVGSQFSSILNAYRGDTIAGATWPTAWKDWCLQNPNEAADMEVIWETPILVNNGLIVHERVSSDVAQRVAVLLSSLDNLPEGIALLENAGFQGFEMASDSTFDSVVEFLKRYEQIIGLPQ